MYAVVKLPEERLNSSVNELLNVLTSNGFTDVRFTANENDVSLPTSNLSANHKSSTDSESLTPSPPVLVSDKPSAFCLSVPKGLSLPTALAGGEALLAQALSRPEPLRYPSGIVCPNFAYAPFVGPEIWHLPFPANRAPKTNAENSEKFSCGHCGYQNEDRLNIRLHIIESHGEKSAFQQSGIDSPPDSRPATNLREFDSSDATEAMIARQQQNSAAAAQLLMRDLLGSNYEAAMSATERGLPRRVQCQLCGKGFLSTKPLSSLLNHAKRHSLLKQFLCPSCPYRSSEAAHVRSHMRLRHKIFNVPPLDSKTPVLQSEWVKVTVQCFPTMASRLWKFRFKTFKRKPTGRRPKLAKTLENEKGD